MAITTRELLSMPEHDSGVMKPLDVSGIKGAIATNQERAAKQQAAQQKEMEQRRRNLKLAEVKEAGLFTEELHNEVMKNLDFYKKAQENPTLENIQNYEDNTVYLKYTRERYKQGSDYIVNDILGEAEKLENSNHLVQGTTDGLRSSLVNKRGQSNMSFMDFSFDQNAFDYLNPENVNLRTYIKDYYDVAQKEYQKFKNEKGDETVTQMYKGKIKTLDPSTGQVVFKKGLPDDYKRFIENAPEIVKRNVEMGAEAAGKSPYEYWRDTAGDMYGGEYTYERTEDEKKTDEFTGWWGDKSLNVVVSGEQTERIPESGSATPEYKSFAGYRLSNDKIGQSLKPIQLAGKTVFTDFSSPKKKISTDLKVEASRLRLIPVKKDDKGNITSIVPQKELTPELEESLVTGGIELEWFVVGNAKAEDISLVSNRANKMIKSKYKTIFIPYNEVRDDISAEYKFNLDDRPIEEVPDIELIQMINKEYPNKTPEQKDKYFEELRYGGE